MSGVAAVDGRDAVITGKHLCGSATDLALRCCLDDTNGRDGDEPSSASSTCRVTGVALATCCHHRCEWRSYVNKPFMRKLGFARDDFPRLARMSSWACDGTAPGVGSVKRPRSFAGEEPTTADATEAADEHGQPPVEDVDDGNMSKAEKYEIGGMVKTLIDVGRVEWLQRRGLHGRLVGYVDTEVSPENRLIVVSRGERS
jgi:tRNA:m4X modification enzyme